VSLVLQFPQETALLVESDGERVVLSMEMPSPPGATLHGALVGESLACTVKVLRCRREATTFRVEGRFVNLSRALRQRVRDAFDRGELPELPDRG
jgi:hypothetical protein